MNPGSYLSRINTFEAMPQMPHQGHLSCPSVGNTFLTNGSGGKGISMNMLNSSQLATARKFALGKNSNSRSSKESPFRNDPKFRKELVARIKKEIAEDTYETDEKWELSLSRLFGSMDC